MSKNPFDLLGDEDDTNQLQDNKPRKDKPKKTTDQRPPVNNVNDHLEPRVKENLKAVRLNEKDPRANKGVQDHRVHDRRPANGRTSEPRKAGGGAGSIGNMKDELNQDKILSKVNEDGTETETPKEPVIPSVTLEEYYQKQGVEIKELEQIQKGPVKKGEIKADWIAKEKMTILKTKEDREIDDRAKTTFAKEVTHKIIMDSTEAQLLGFKSALSENKPREPREAREAREAAQDKERAERKDNRKPRQDNPKKGAKPMLQQEDFPAL